ncbi:hypothetical protein Droror1_Dr00015541 [Drosera rotundifolia]
MSASAPSVPPSVSPSDSVSKICNQSSVVSIICSQPSVVSKICNKHSRSWVEAFLLVGVVLSVCMCFASRRRYISTAWFRYPLWAAYLLIGSIVPYTLGLMSDQPTMLRSKLYPAWGFLFVAIANGNSGSISAFNLDDNENGVKLFFEHIMLSFYMLGLFRGSSFSGIGMSVLLLVAFVQQIYIFGKKVRARRLASLQSKVGPCEIVAVLTRHKEIFELELENRREMVNPSSMTGYRYLVDPIKGEVENAVTVGKIWSCQGRVLNTGNVVEDEKRKDLCLSFALFWLLLQRYGGYTVHEPSQDESWRLVGEKLLPGDDGEHERAFRVIEVELHFLYDLFYTTHCATYTLSRFWSMFMDKFWWVVIYIGMAEKYDAASAKFWIYGYSMDGIVTWILIGTLIALILLECYDDVTSIWTKVDLICYYVRKELWKNKYFEKMLAFILGINWRMHHHWERKLGQYSFLDSYHYAPWWRPTAAYIISHCFLDPDSILRRDGQSEGIRIKLSEQVKKAIAKSIKKNGQRLSDGTQALLGHGFIGEELFQRYPFTTTTEYILTWHIATDFASRCDPDRNTDAREAYEVVRDLSRYCAYLVAFAPELLPDHQFIAETTFDALVSSAKILETVTLEATLMNTTPSTGDVGGWILKRAANLAEMLNRCDQRWNMLAEFWADLLVYLAPSDNAKAHAQHLATGGEFITHIWALLTHGGIITRKNGQVGAFGVSPDPTIV